MFYLLGDVTMSLDEIPSGYLGNLSKQQEVCLKQMWAGIFSLSGLGEILQKGSAIPSVDISEASKIVWCQSLSHRYLCAKII